MYKRFRSRLINHPNPLISALSSQTQYLEFLSSLKEDGVETLTHNNYKLKKFKKLYILKKKCLYLTFKIKT